MVFKLTRERIALLTVIVISAVLNLANLSIEGWANQYYAAGVKSMTTSLKNFFFVTLDPAGFVTIDKPPLGFWMQAVSARIFGFSGWSILLPQALAGVISVVIIYIIVKRSFGSTAGLISALCLSVTPVFVAASRNNTVDNQLVMVLLLGCWAISIAAEKENFKYLILSLLFVGLGFNIKMLQAYMILPAMYILYLFSASVPGLRRMLHLLAGTAVLLLVSLSWAWAVDSIPAESRPYIGSSDNNTVMSLITGHNGAERLGGIFNIFKTGSGKPSAERNIPPGQHQDDARFPGGSAGNAPPAGSDYGSNRYQAREDIGSGFNAEQSYDNANEGINDPDGSGLPGPGDPPGDAEGRQNPGGNSLQQPLGGGLPGGGGPGNNNGLSGAFGNQTPAGLTRLFAKNILSDQIVWFIPLAVLGFIAAAKREKLTFCLDNKRKQALVLWFMWFLPEFIYFSYNTGLFHNYYLTMLAPPIAALTGIGAVSMWKMYKDGGRQAWFLPLALLVNGAVQLQMLIYFYNNSDIIKILLGLLLAFNFGPALLLAVRKIRLLTKQSPAVPGTAVDKNQSFRIHKVLAGFALAGLVMTPATGSAAAIFYPVNSSFPAAGLELFPAEYERGTQPTDQLRYGSRSGVRSFGVQGDNLKDLVNFLNNHQVGGKSQIVASSISTAENIILNSDLYVGSLSGFMGNEKVMSLEKFIGLVEKGEVGYVLAEPRNNRGEGNSGSEIMNWVKQNGKLVSYTQSDNGDQTSQLYDLTAYSQ